MGNKFGARKTYRDGFVFDSGREADRYTELCLLQAAGRITGLVVHNPRFTLEVNGVTVSRYTPDFSYLEDGVRVIEDVKSGPTRRRNDYVMRKKLVRALFGLTIRETE